jgi:Meckel syndrome type 1 protein
MSMTYTTPETRAAAADDSVFVPRYARSSKARNKPVKTWMILAPIGAVVVIGGAAALMMGGGEPEPTAAMETSPAPAEAASIQAAPAAMAAAETPVAANA